MIKFSNLSTIRQMYNTFYSLLKHNRNIKASILQKTNQYNQQIGSQRQINKHIAQLDFQNYSDISCIARWGSVSDRQFGGNSKGQVYYNSLMRHVHLKGNINITDKDKLQTIPFIGMLQRLPFYFKVGIYNALRIKIIGDGHPITCMMQIQSPIQGTRTAQAYILTKKSTDWMTYEIPFLNFQMQGQQLASMADASKNGIHKISKMITTQLLNPGQLQIRTISFRLQSNQNIKRQVLFKKISLVRTVRGDIKYEGVYQRPYFYLVDQNQTKDQLLKKLVVGKYEYYTRN